MDYLVLAQEAAARAEKSPDAESRFYAAGQRDAYLLVDRHGDAARQVEFALSCVKSAESERDWLRAELEALRAKIVERAGQEVFDAWSCQIAAERRPKPPRNCAQHWMAPEGRDSNGA